MNKKYLVVAIVCLLIGLGFGVLVTQLSKQNQANYQARLDFETGGFDQTKTNELVGQIKEIKRASLILSLPVAKPNVKDLRAMSARMDKEVLINQQTQILAKSLKTDEDKYGAVALAQIAKLEEQKKAARSSRSKALKISQQISVIKKAAVSAVAAKVAELTKQLALLKPEETEARLKLTQEISALNSDYKFTVITLADLRVGENVTLSNKGLIDMKKEVVAERLVVSR